jgi:predicted nucleotidyltransferase
VTDAELLARAEELQAEASDFLLAHHVEERLRATGSVLLVGSYVTGLMVWRDLDVCVDAAGLGRAEAWELVRPFVLEAERVRYEDIEEPGDCLRGFKNAGSVAALAVRWRLCWFRGSRARADTRSRWASQLIG